MNSASDIQDGETRVVEEIERLGGNLDEEQRKRIAEKIREIRNFVPKIGVFGKTGAGKSHLCNALFGREVAKISDVGACTREPQRIVLEAGTSGICLIDVPGVGESPERDAEYSDLYKRLLPELDIVLWVIKADDRALSVDQVVYKDCVAPLKATIPTVFVINQVDKLEPIREWDVAARLPGAKQSENIKEKLADVGRIFDVEVNQISAVSAAEGYGLAALVQHIVNTLPNEKKFGVVREAKKENVTRESEREAERGIWEAIKEFAGKAYEVYKENKETIHTIVAAIWSIFAKKK
ncbi:GTPase family protein [Burkholderia plantarii]|uniref:GTPase family protein n=1 Tax=Burkholderia plantarii TaxID=41899 RepID=UPI0009F6EE27|nr:GTPase [Burkholderia plantarii]